MRREDWDGYKTSLGLRRYAKGARSVVAGLKIVLDPRSIVCPACNDTGQPSVCFVCLNVGFVIPEGGSE